MLLGGVGTYTHTHIHTHTHTRGGGSPPPSGSRPGTQDGGGRRPRAFTLLQRQYDLTVDSRPPTY